MFQTCSSSSTFMGSGPFGLNLGPVSANDKGLLYSDLPKEINKLFHQKKFSEYFNKTYLENSILHISGKFKIITYLCHFLNVYTLGLYGFKFAFTDKSQPHTNDYLFGRMGFLISVKLIENMIINLENKKYIEENNNKLISRNTLKDLFHYLPESLIMKMNCKQFSYVIKKFPFSLDELRKESKLSDEKSYLLKKIPMITTLTRAAFKKCYRSWDLFAEINRHPILLDALKCNLRPWLRKDPKIQKILSKFTNDINFMLPPPIKNVTSNPDYREPKLMSPIPFDKLYGFLMYYLENVEHIKVCQSPYDPINSLDRIMRDSNGELIHGAMLYPKIIQSLSRSLFYSRYPVQTYHNIYAFLHAFGMEQYEICVLDMCHEHFSKLLLVDNDVIVLNRLLGLIPIVDRVDVDNRITILKNYIDTKLSSKEVLMQFWDRAEKDGLEPLKNHIINFCINNTEFAEETWLAVPREIRANGFQSSRRLRQSPRMVNLSLILNG